MMLEQLPLYYDALAFWLFVAALAVLIGLALLSQLHQRRRWMPDAEGIAFHEMLDAQAELGRYARDWLEASDRGDDVAAAGALRHMRTAHAWVAEAQTALHQVREANHAAKRR